jgi:hypothetical protein
VKQFGISTIHYYCHFVGPQAARDQAAAEWLACRDYLISESSAYPLNQA